MGCGYRNGGREGIITIRSITISNESARLLEACILGHFAPRTCVHSSPERSYPCNYLKKEGCMFSNVLDVAHLLLRSGATCRRLFLALDVFRIVFILSSRDNSPICRVIIPLVTRQWTRHRPDRK